MPIHPTIGITKNTCTQPTPPPPPPQHSQKDLTNTQYFTCPTHHISYAMTNRLVAQRILVVLDNSRMITKLKLRSLQAALLQKIDDVDWPFPLRYPTFVLFSRRFLVFDTTLPAGTTEGICSANLLRMASSLLSGCVRHCLELLVARTRSWYPAATPTAAVVMSSRV